MRINQLKGISNEYKSILKLGGSPVAIKLFREPVELEGIVARKLDKQVRHICQLISQAWYIGRTSFINPVTITQSGGLGCALGTACFGWRKFTTANARKYFGTYFIKEEYAEGVINTIPKFNEGEYASILFAPLENCPLIPDVVVFYGNVGQMIAILRGYLYNKTEGLSFDTAALAACADAIITPIKYGRFNLALPCNGFRLNALPSETDFICGVPADELEEVLKGIKFNFRGGVRYPTAWQHIDRDLQIIFPLDKYISGEPSSETDTTMSSEK
ncbi:MAG: DUF169 domain-containing protein [Candidatus Bathyarchaeota archaeon]